MNLKKIAIDFITNFAVIFIVAALVSFLYNLIIHATGEFDWENAFRLSIIFGIVLTWMNSRKKS